MWGMPTRRGQSPQERHDVNQMISPELNFGGDKSPAHPVFHPASPEVSNKE